MKKSSIKLASKYIQNYISINYIICGILGLLLNTIVVCLLVSKLKKRGSHTDIKICTIVASFDILSCLGLLTRSILVKYKVNLLVVNLNWCKLDVLITQCINLSGYTLAVMSIERFLLICFNISLSIYFWFALIFIVDVILYSLSFACTANNLVSITSTGVNCTLLTSGVCYYTFLITTIIFLVSFITVILSYLGIMVAKAKQCLSQINLNIQKSIVYSELMSTLIKSTINILLYIIVFSIKIYGLAFVIITGKKRELWVEVVSQILISYAPLVNSTILLYMNQSVRILFIDLLKSIKVKLLPNRN